MGEHGQQGEREGKANAEAEHGDEAHPAVGAAGGEAYESSPQDRTGAGETYKHRGKGNEEGGEEASFVGLFVAGVHPFLGHLNLKQSEEAQCKDKEDDEEDDVGNPMRAKDIERFGAKDESQYRTQHCKEEYDGETEEPGLTPPLALVFGSAHEEIHRHRYHREHTGCEHR